MSGSYQVGDAIRQNFHILLISCIMDIKYHVLVVYKI